MNLAGKIVNFLGDSITEGIGTSVPENRYPDVLKEEAGLALVRNYGIGGTRIANQIVLKEDIDYKSFCQRYEMMDDDADIIVVFGGTNDYGHGDAPFGEFSDRGPDTYCGACHTLMQGLINKYPEKIIVFMTPIHRTDENVPNTSNNRPLKDYVDVIKKTAEFYSIPVLDLYAMGGIMPDIPIQRERLCPDGVHPNDLGSKRIADRLKGFLETL